LLEQAAGVGAGGVAVVEDEEGGLADGGHDADGLVSFAQGQVVARGDDVGGVDELVAGEAGDRTVGHRCEVDGHAGGGRGAARGRRRAPEEQHAEHQADEAEGEDQDEESGGGLAVHQFTPAGGVIDSPTQGAVASVRLRSSSYTPASVGTSTRARKALDSSTSTGSPVRALTGMLAGSTKL